MNTENAVLVVGGYGTVGQQAVQFIRQRHPTLPLIIAGRHPKKAVVVAQELEYAIATIVNLELPNPLGTLRPAAILALANDPQDYLLTDAIKLGIPYVDITRWTERVRSAATLGPLSAPVMLASGWMAGIATLIAVATTRQLTRTNRIDISILYSLQDKAGPNSVEYMDRLATPFEVMLNGRLTHVYPYTDPRKITFPGGYTASAYRFDTPDQLTLPNATGAQTVSARIAFNDALTTGLLVALTRSGIWKLFSGSRFTPLRRQLLYNPGSGANHEMVIEVAGIDEDGKEKILRTTVVDPKGQTHLTTVGALIQLERILGLDGGSSPPPGITYPDVAPQISHALDTLTTHGIIVTTIHDDSLLLPN